MEFNPGKAAAFGALQSGNKVWRGPSDGEGTNKK